jgi:hypothetical protein
LTNATRKSLEVTDEIIVNDDNKLPSDRIPENLVNRIRFHIHQVYQGKFFLAVAKQIESIHEL